MNKARNLYRVIVLVALALSGVYAAGNSEGSLPQFGRDTVLVWKSENLGTVSTFVVRLAEFLPDRFLEWEDEKTQGTILMPNKAVTGAKGFVSARLFEGGVDTKGKNATTLWLSTHLFQDLKANKKIKVSLDGVDGIMTLGEPAHLSVEVNRVRMDVPVVKVMDNRGSERWFLDSDDNPLMVKHTVRQFSQTLTSITTDRANTLRWIKGKKLPPQK